MNFLLLNLSCTQLTNLDYKVIKIFKLSIVLNNVDFKKLKTILIKLLDETTQYNSNLNNLTRYLKFKIICKNEPSIKVLLDKCCTVGSSLTRQNIEINLNDFFKLADELCKTKSSDIHSFIKNTSNASVRIKLSILDYQKKHTKKGNLYTISDQYFYDIFKE